MSEYLQERLGTIFDVIILLIVVGIILSVVSYVIFIILMVKHNKKIEMIKKEQEKRAEEFNKDYERITAEIRDTKNHFQD